MAFERTKEQLKDNWADLSSKIQENSAFNNLREKFEAQSPTIQRAIVSGGSALFVLFMISFPWAYISESMNYITEFEDNRGLIQGLLRASRSAKEPSPLPAPIGSDVLKGRVDAIVKESRLIPDQVGEMQALPDKPAKDLAPDVVIQTGLAVQLKSLNLEQVIALSHQFQTMGPGTKLMGLDIVQSPRQSHYYDMIARVVSFALPAMASLDESPPEGKKGGKAGKKPAHKTEEESGE